MALPVNGRGLHGMRVPTQGQDPQDPATDPLLGDDTAIKSQLLSQFAKMNDQKGAQEMQAKYAPAPAAPAMPEMAEPMDPTGMDDLGVGMEAPQRQDGHSVVTDGDGVDVRTSGIAGPQGAQDLSEPSLLLAALSSDDVRKLLGDISDLDTTGLAKKVM